MGTYIFSETNQRINVKYVTDAVYEENQKVLLSLWFNEVDGKGLHSKIPRCVVEDGNDNRWEMKGIEMFSRLFNDGFQPDVKFGGIEVLFRGTLVKQKP